MLLRGAPGCGKTMLARRLPSLLPDLEFNEALEVTQIHSAAGLFDRIPIATQRPFRAPHHTASSAGLLGGGGALTRPATGLGGGGNGVVYVASGAGAGSTNGGLETTATEESPRSNVSH